MAIISTISNDVGGTSDNSSSTVAGILDFLIF